MSNYKHSTFTFSNDVSILKFQIILRKGMRLFCLSEGGISLKLWKVVTGYLNSQVRPNIPSTEESFYGDDYISQWYKPSILFISINTNRGHSYLNELKS